MNENMKKFIEQLATDPALAEKMGQIQTQYVESITKLAKKAGYDLSEEDFMPKDRLDEQLSEEELAEVAGGEMSLWNSEQDVTIPSLSKKPATMGVNLYFDWLLSRI